MLINKEYCLGDFLQFEIIKRDEKLQLIKYFHHIACRQVSGIFSRLLTHGGTQPRWSLVVLESGLSKRWMSNLLTNIEECSPSGPWWY